MAFEIRPHIFLGVSGLLVCSYALTIFSSPIPAIFSFGDANVETGNNNYINTTLKADFSPFGETYFGQPSGRVTDGRITLDFIASYLGLPFVEPYLKPDADFSHGVNFGSGGAGALDIADSTSNRGIPLSQQLAYFQDVRNNASLHNISDSNFSEGLYYVQIGEVDYLELLLIGQQFSPALSVFPLIQSAVISSIQDAILQLYGYGARKFLIFNVYNLGCIPILLASSNNASASCVQPVDEQTESHNAALADSMVTLRSSLPDASIILVKSDRVLLEALADPPLFGFEDTLTACCGSGLFNGATACGEGNYSLCENPRARIYWDQVHNTEALFEMVAEEIWSGVDYVEPYNLQYLT